MTESSFRRLLLRFALVPILCFSIFLAILGSKIHQITLNRQQGAEATSTLLQSSSLLQSMMDEETGVRGYLVSRDPLFLQPYREASARFNAELATLASLVAAKPAPAAQVQAITDTFKRFDTINQSLLRGSLSADEVEALLKDQKQAMDSLRAQLAALMAEETETRASKIKAIDSLLGSLPQLGIGGGILIAVLFIWHGIYLFRKITRAFRQQLAESIVQRDSLHTTLHSIGDAVIVCDASGNITLMNPTAEKVTGWTNAQAMGKPLEAIFHIINEDTRQIVESPVAKVKRLGVIVDLANHTLLVRKDGTELPIDDSGAPIWGVSGDLAGIVLVFRSVAERRQAANALRLSEERLRLALTAARSVGIWDWDVPNDLFYADEMVSQIHGVDPAKARTGAPIEEFIRNVHPEDREGVEQSIQQALKTCEDFSAEYRVIQADESVRWVSAVGRCSLGPDNTPARFPGLTVDITAQKQIEEALLQSEKLAVVGRLAASIAHEINNPLESVTNLLYLARGVNDTPMIDKYLETADRELRRVAAITSQTLRFHKQSTKPMEVTGEQLIESVLSMFQGRIINSNSRVEKQIRSRAAVRCFEGEIRQVISNLVANALDAMYPSGGRLELRAREGRDQRTGRAGLIFSVADTGPGMPEAVADQAFQPFFTTKGLLGTGLGLWISREIVERHSGRLLLRTSQREGHTGTVISLFLPFDAISR